MQDPLTVWLIGDGKPGHENQSLGLIEAMSRLRPCEEHRIDVSAAGSFFARGRRAMKQAKALPEPDLLIGAGHSSHWPLWRLRKSTGAPAVVLMKPSLPMSCFDFCLAPRHDFDGELPQREGLIVTEGALNRVVAGDQKRAGNLILLGGPSKTHAWDADGMMNLLRQLTEQSEWRMTDSRRTPEGFAERVAKELPSIDIHPHGETGPDWLPGIMQQVEEIWVSEDSVSMTYEALSSGAKVGLLPVPRLRQWGRVLRGLDRLLEQKRLSSFASWLEAGRTLPQAQPLREADRCARLLLDALNLGTSR